MSGNPCWEDHHKPSKSHKYISIMIDGGLGGLGTLNHLK